MLLAKIETQHAKTPYKHSKRGPLLVSAAGPFVSFVAGVGLALAGFYYFGIPSEKTRPTVTSVAPGSIAEQYDLRVNDIVSATWAEKKDNTPGEITFDNSNLVMSILRPLPHGKFKRLKLTMPRARKVSLGWSETTSKIDLGFSLRKEKIRFDLPAAYDITSELTKSGVLGIIRFFKDDHAFIDDPSKQHGIIRGFAPLASDIERGITYFIILLLQLSLAIAITNLVPIPGLDGWQVLIGLCEWLVGRPVPYLIERRIARCGVNAITFYAIYLASKDIIEIIMEELL